MKYSISQDSAESKLTIMLYDYSGHPFQAQLARELAQLGHRVSHRHCPSYESGKGSLERVDGDPRSVSSEGIPMRSTFSRYSPAKRVVQEFQYGLALVDD